MLDKYILTLSSDAMEADDLKPVITDSEDSVKIVLQSKKPITNIKLMLTYDYKFASDDRLYLNGYESWTDSKEYFIDDKIQRVGWLFRRIKNFDCSGDLFIVDRKKNKDLLYGFSYSYIRSGDTYRLIGSMGEENGYTVIKYDTKNGKIHIEKDLEGVTVDGEYLAMEIKTYLGGYNEVFDKYFADLKIAPPRVKHAVGYTSWYNYYTNVSEADVVRDLQSIVDSGSKIDIFQIDDGFERAVGDWLELKEGKFSQDLKPLVDKIKACGMKAGLWLAPFNCDKGSHIYRDHKDWLVCDDNGVPICAGLNWGGFYTLDIYKEEPRNYIKKVFDVVLNEWGFDMVKLDFLYSTCMQPRYGKSRGQLMCEGMDFLRELVGDKILLGCGVPLMPAFGKVDYCRTGPDVALKWKENCQERKMHRERVSTPNGVNNSIFRRHLDGRAFVNDPDVYFLRSYNIQHRDSHKALLASINKLFGNLLFVSDDVSTYDEKALERFKKMNADDDIKIIDAKYISDSNIKVVYSMNDQEKNFIFNVKNGELLAGTLPIE